MGTHDALPKFTFGWMDDTMWDIMINMYYDQGYWNYDVDLADFAFAYIGF